MPRLPNLPVGDSSFESIRQNEQLYVDKTSHIYRMVDQGKYYFLSRPRRFGKSLTVSTLRCLFEGRRELFEGLWIAEHGEWDWREHPVVLLDFNGISHETPDILTASLHEHIGLVARANDIPIQTTMLKGRFMELIIALHQKTGQKVVILVDEYDKPLIDHLGKGEKELNIAKGNRDKLKQFFGVIKESNVADALRFVFITGVSKFSRVSIFSELNNLTDLTMSRHYAEMLGYTQEELEASFVEYVAHFARETDQTSQEVLDKLRLMYNGYRFSEKDVRVYNPFSVLSSLQEQAFRNYWFETGTPTFLINLLREKNWYLPEIENMQATVSMFSTYDLENLQPEALLFQTGYVTIKDISGRLYTFDYPNQEVKSAFLEKLLHTYAQNLRDQSRFVLLAEHLLADDLTAFMDTVAAIFKDLAYTLETNRDESYFHTVFYLMVSASGVDARSEVLTCDGRIDLVMHVGERIYIIEFKCNQSADEALAQIKDKGYAQAYRGLGKQIILLGINFDTQKRNVSEWKAEEDGLG
ncbi:ATP-binding protein [Desulfonatronum sp. SC1]|uniref:ATP-binding protein n=1 Tax=Desulfonatronum sp. SC1 TaxID=2109626 RepID=UPI000D30A715|nr:ATP-binding protein [Desulfonatronum sp. SC1]PTN37060.1 AAA family ATPase [Desulfonatronum sp. SC1]